MDGTPVIVFSDAKVVTMDKAKPQAEAVCVVGDRIAAVGNREDMPAVASGIGAYSEQKLGGGTLYPGFIDTHSHLSSFSNCIDEVYCGASLGSIAGVLDALRAKASASDDEWIIGYGYDDSGIPDNRHLTRHDLDSVSTERPVFVMHISIHMGYANSVALERLGFDAGTRIPGGEIALDADGQPNGLILENAFIEALNKLPAPDHDQICRNLERAMAVYNKAGFTTFMDGGLGLNGDASVFLSAYVQLAREGRMSARAYLQFLPGEMDKLIALGVWGMRSDYVVLGGAKFFADGSIQGFTGALLEDYHSRPGYRGNLIWSPEEIAATILKYHRQGIQVAVHTNGDAASEAVIQGFEKAVEAFPRTDLRHMVVHSQTASDPQLARLKACGVLPTLFSRHIEVWGDRHAALYLGPERTARMDPAGSCVRLGMPFGLHVDSPVLPVTALGSMHAAVNRVSSGGVLFGAEQRISAREALKAYTTYASLFCYGDGDRGMIAPGRYADFVLLDKDIEEADPSAIRDIRVLTTVCGGRVVYQA